MRYTCICTCGEGISTNSKIASQMFLVRHCSKGHEAFRIGEEDIQARLQVISAVNNARQNGGRRCIS